MDLGYWEFSGALAYTFAAGLDPTVGVSVWVSPDFFGEDGNALALIGSFGLSLPAGFGLGLEVGNQDVDGDKTTTGYRYTWYKAGLGKQLGGFELALAYWGTGDEEECGGDLCDARVVFTLSSAWSH